MPIYQIEGGINFYDELYKSLDDKIDEDSGSDVCLITNAPLEENCIILGCNHKFNYDAIYNDILNHKKKYNSMERQAIKSREIRCPYCRTINKTLLPQREGYKNVHGVNHYDDTQELIHKSYGSEYIHGKCNYIYKHNSPNIPDYSCSNKYVKLLQLDGKHYCGGHHNQVLNKTIKDNKIKDKEQKKEALLIEKIKANEEKQKIKEEKQKAKEEKLKEKLDGKIAKTTTKKTTTKKTTTKKTTNINILDENVILSASSSSAQSGCNQILKTGKNKGATCCVKIFQDGFCMRHYKLQHPVSTEEHDA